MAYSFRVTEKIQMVNEVLRNLGAKPLWENPDFKVDPTWHADWHVEFDLIPVEREYFDIHIVIDEDYIRFDIENFSEVAVWTNESISKSNAGLIAFITNLLSSRVSISRTAGWADLTFFDPSGRQVDTLHVGNYVNRLLDKVKKSRIEQTVYPPLYGQGCRD